MHDSCASAVSKTLMWSLAVLEPALPGATQRPGTLQYPRRRDQRTPAAGGSQTRASSALISGRGALLLRECGDQGGI
jgi:hypothetical protein